MTEVVAIVGLGRIGLPTAVAFAGAGFEVRGVDNDAEVLSSIRGGRLRFDEPGLEAESLSRVSLHDSVEDVEANAWIVCLGTNVDGRIRAEGVADVIRRIVENQPSTPLIVVESTIPPGTCATIAEDHGVPVVHCPERAAPGNVLADIATTPRLVGGVNEAATLAGQELYSRITEAPLVACTATQAELAKIAENASRDAEIAFANTLAAVARDVGLDPFSVIELANSHPRVNILRPGLGVGGDCLGMASEYLSSGGSALSAAVRGVNGTEPTRLARRILALPPRPTAVAVLGTTYKPNIRYEHDPFREPPVGALLRRLRDDGIDVRPWDPSLEGSLEQALDGADLVVFGCAHDAFGQLDPAELKRHVTTPRFVDPVGAVARTKWQNSGWTAE